jgi:hypothetical protein
VFAAQNVHLRMDVRGGRWLLYPLSRRHEPRESDLCHPTKNQPASDVDCERQMIKAVVWHCVCLRLEGCKVPLIDATLAHQTSFPRTDRLFDVVM